jgi:putative FmdB family regulatory protein
MPIYEYECEKCGHAFEREQRMSDAPVKTCPKCKARKVTKLISLSSFSLKGGGWYADGYSDNKKTNDDKSSPPAEGASGDSSDASKDDKPAPKKDDTKSTGGMKKGGAKKGGAKKSKSAA